MNTDVIEVASLKEFLRDKNDYLFFSVSPEPRSLVVWATARELNIGIVAFHNQNHDYLRRDVNMVAGATKNLSLCPLNSDEPVESFDAMREIVGKICVKGQRVKVAMDISGFTREALAMLLAVLKFTLPEGSVVSCLYTKAADYPEETPGGERQLWFSRGIAEIRSIFGYRGNVKLLGRTHLILLPGFETERAEGIVEALEPDRITIGQVAPGESVQPHFAVRAERMVKRIESFYPDKRIAHFSFSAQNPYMTRDQVGLCVREDENTVIACLNSKVAMVGVCMTAMEHPGVQLIYAQPLNYNIGAVPKASSEVIVFPFL